MMEATIALYKSKQEILEGEVTRIHDKWKVDNKKLHEAESNVDYGWVGWTAAAILAITTISFGTAFVLK